MASEETPDGARGAIDAKGGSTPSAPAQATRSHLSDCRELLKRAEQTTLGSWSAPDPDPEICARDCDLADEAIRRSGVIVGAAFDAPREFARACALARRQGWESAVQRCTAEITGIWGADLVTTQAALDELFLQCRPE